MEKDNRYTEEDLNNVVQYETSLQILKGIKELRKTDPRPMTVPVVKMEGKPDLTITQTEWETIKGFSNGAANQLRLAGKGCIVREIAQKYK